MKLYRRIPRRFRVGSNPEDTVYSGIIKTGYLELSNNREHGET